MGGGYWYLGGSFRVGGEDIWVAVLGRGMRICRGFWIFGWQL